MLRSGPYRFFFYGGDASEPPRIHVERDDCECKFWLDPIRFERSEGFRLRDIQLIQSLVEQHQEMFSEAWNEFFGG